MNDNLRKLEEEYFKMVYGEEELSRVNLLPPIKSPKYSKHKIITVRDRIDFENNLKQKYMEKDNLKKYKVKAKDSFNTKWKLFLFNHVISKSNTNGLTFDEFLKFEIDDKLVQVYSAEYWQKDRKDELNSIEIDKIFTTLRSLDIEEIELKKECSIHYEKHFEKKVFPKNEFLTLLKEEKCQYCNLTIDKVKELAKKKQLFKKNERGWSLEIDRKNSNEEYKKDNCVMSCYWCNNAKTDEFTFKEFKEIGKSFEKVWKERLK